MMRAADFLYSYIWRVEKTTPMNYSHYKAYKVTIKPEVDTAFDKVYFCFDINLNYWLEQMLKILPNLYKN